MLGCSEAVVRSGFQSLQLVIADFLPAIPHSCVTACVDMSGQYGLQIVDINISLTSIGLLVRRDGARWRGGGAGWRRGGLDKEGGLDGKGVGLDGNRFFAGNFIQRKVLLSEGDPRLSAVPLQLGLTILLHIYIHSTCTSPCMYVHACVYLNHPFMLLLQWNLADYLYQNKRSLRTSLSHGLFDSVWMQLFK